MPISSFARCVLCSALAALVGCGGGERASAKEASASKPANKPVPSALPVPAAPAGLAVELEVAKGGYALRIQNRGASRVTFASKLTLERKKGDRFEQVTGQALAIVGDCKDAPPCLALAPGAERLPLMIQSRVGAMQCQIGEKLLSQGEYRIVVHGCNESPFVLPSASVPMPAR